MQKLVQSGPAQIRGLAPGQHSCEETSQQWRDASDNVSDLASPVNEPSTYHADIDVFNLCANWPLYLNKSFERKNSVFLRFLRSRIRIVSQIIYDNTKFSQTQLKLSSVTNVLCQFQLQVFVSNQSHSCPLTKQLFGKYNLFKRP